MKIAYAPQAQKGVSHIMSIADYSPDGLGALSIDPDYLTVGRVASVGVGLYGGLSGNKLLRNVGIAATVAIFLLQRRLGHTGQAQADAVARRRAALLANLPPTK